MITRMKTHCKDDTCPSCVVAGGFIFLAHHSGGHEKVDIEFQIRASLNALRKTLRSVNAELEDMVQLNLYLRNRADFDKARNVFPEYFTEQQYPVRTTLFTDFVNESCLCMLDGVAFKSE
ncbi:2-aminomuconate deaminase [Yersinia frederiksenii]|uniref:2-aminomuconate deaminase n=2 Tax=Yersinia frederiksenii TaxID=29484 RepID=A0A380PWV6_YERFR|nr:RidA family protein [Yersinia frederiksenii]ATM97509.1 RidA family protein [Yersinia frederiksenii]EEQ15926.1 translation initiation inhibitor, yjgF family [Yersinia frederiksenii ATCC 33641]KGA46426.1 endoribonuclease L-PSP family protein [Yersinia frederiksenii ATCC 33641]MDN0120452.1 RidA family protein [Yersinia frederiksenii]CFR00758.1 2-aminomuconate deaminase [Yersinia frederiksenii]